MVSDPLRRWLHREPVAVNKEVRRKRRLRAGRAILASAIVQGLFALVNAVQGAMHQQLEQFLLPGLGCLVLAIFFALFRHPFFGIAYTAIYLLYRVLNLSVLLVLPQLFPQVSGLALTLGTFLALAASTLFVYADYQAIVLRRLTESD